VTDLDAATALLGQLADTLRCELAVDSTSRSLAAEDFGHVLRRQPRAVLRPRCVADIADALRIAGEHGCPVAARGQGHATFGQAQAPGGLVVDMTGLRQIHRVTADRVVVDAGARWSDVLAATLPRGLTPPVLTDYLELSIGGTLSAGGISGTTFRHGIQADTVLELDVVTGDGVARTCSPRHDRELFHAVLAGLGQCAVITRATVRLVAAHPRVRRFQVYYPEIHSFTADQLWLVGQRRFDYVEGKTERDHAGRRWYVLEAAVFGWPADLPTDADLLDGLHHLRGSEEIEDLDYLRFLARIAPGEAAQRASGEWFQPHPWWNTFIPASRANEIIDSVANQLTTADLGESGLALVYPFPTGHLTAPLFRVPAEPVAFLFALLRTAAPDDPTTLAAMTAANRQLYEQVRAAGGTAYPVGTIPLTPQDWRRHFGERWPLLTEAKRRYDPRGILGVGHGIFPAPGEFSSDSDHQGVV
jgi:cytokinin dehydrogenase